MMSGCSVLMKEIQDEVHASPFPMGRVIHFSEVQCNSGSPASHTTLVVVGREVCVCVWGRGISHILN